MMTRSIKSNFRLYYQLCCEAPKITVNSSLSKKRTIKITTKCNSANQCFCIPVIGAWQRAGRRLRRASGEYSRVAISVCVISVLASRRQTSAITQPRDPANMSAYVRSRCARTARKTALAPVCLLLYNNYRLIKICYLTLR